MRLFAAFAGIALALWLGWSAAALQIAGELEHLPAMPSTFPIHFIPPKP